MDRNRLNIVKLVLGLVVLISIGPIIGSAMQDPCQFCHTDQSFNGQDPHTMNITNNSNSHKPIKIKSISSTISSTIKSSTTGYTNITDACITCHDGVIAPYKRPHNNTMMCEFCHGGNPHSVKFIQPDGSLGFDNSTAATCIDCHQTGTVPANNSNFSTAYVIKNRLHHSNDPNNGSIWTRSGDQPFWTGSDQLSSCIYCHNDTKHNIIALGYPNQFEGNNIVRSYGTWCTSCHYQGDPQYNNMISTMNLIPPEITRNATYGAYTSQKYYDHSLIGTYQDTRCEGCHGNRPTVSSLTHDVTSGAGGPDCVSCHDVSAHGAPYLVNVSAMNRPDSIHLNLNKDAVTSYNQDDKRCWACHGNGQEPAQHPSNYKTPYTCTDCHAGSNRNFTPSTVPVVNQHYWNGAQIITSGVSSCYQCHNKSEMMNIANSPDNGSGIINGGANAGNNSASHYGKKRLDLLSLQNTRSYCDYCHNSSSAFTDVFTDINNTNIQSHSRYLTTPACQDCHGNGRIHDSTLNFTPLTLPTSTICITCHGPGGTATIKDKNKHNNMVDCSVCHLDIGKGIHPIKYLTNSGSFSLTKSDGVKCKDCHETGLYNAPSVGVVQHSTNPNNGSLWNAGRPSIFWDNTISSSNCVYCHGDTKHNTSALGKPDLFKGTNTVNVFGDWCGTCHYQNNVQYNIMVNINNLLIPPEITGNPTYGNYVSASDGTSYFNHSLSTYTDNDCKHCHGSGVLNLTGFVHGVQTGGSSCLGCHGIVGTSYYIDTTTFGLHSDVDTTDGPGVVSDSDCKTCHFNLQRLDQMKPGYANKSNTYFCQDCHKSGGRQPAIYNIMPSNLRVDTLQHAKNNCENCHIAGENIPKPNSYKYHPNGPKGTAAGKNCYSCHFRSDGQGNDNFVDMATVGLNNPPFFAPGEDHKCDQGGCHVGGLSRPTLNAGDGTGCDFCHSYIDNHVTVTGTHTYAGISISGLTVTSPVNSGQISTVSATISNRFVQVARAQYRINDSTNTVLIRDWTEMNASDGDFNGRSEGITANIDTTGLSGSYTVLVRGMVSGSKWAPSGGSNHDPSKRYYPDNGVWTNTVAVNLQVFPSLVGMIWITGYNSTTGNVSSTMASQLPRPSDIGTEFYGQYDSRKDNAGWFTVILISDVSGTGAILNIDYYNNDGTHYGSPTTAIVPVNGTYTIIPGNSGLLLGSVKIKSNNPVASEKRIAQYSPGTWNSVGIMSTLMPEKSSATTQLYGQYDSRKDSAGWYTVILISDIYGTGAGLTINYYNNDGTPYGSPVSVILPVNGTYTLLPGNSGLSLGKVKITSTKPVVGEKRIAYYSPGTWNGGDIMGDSMQRPIDANKEFIVPIYDGRKDTDGWYSVVLLSDIYGTGANVILDYLYPDGTKFSTATGIVPVNGVLTIVPSSSGLQYGKLLIHSNNMIVGEERIANFIYGTWNSTAIMSINLLKDTDGIGRLVVPQYDSRGTWNTTVIVSSENGPVSTEIDYFNTSGILDHIEYNNIAVNGSYVFYPGDATMGRLNVGRITIKKI